METPFSTSSPANLYALILKLRPLHYGTLMAFSGELVHTAWLSWLRSEAPDVATWLHEGNKRRLFTCSSLQFPIPLPRMREAERDNIHLPVDPEKIYTVRITLLLGEIFPLFYNALMNFNVQQTKAIKPPFMQIGKQLFLLEEIVVENNDPSGWTGFTSFANLMEKAKTLKVGKVQHLKLEFSSLTAFNRSNARNREYGRYEARLPLPEFIFPGLARRWEELAPPELTSIVQRERVEQYCLDEGVIIADYDLMAHQVKFTTHMQLGFTGMCNYALRSPDEVATDEAPLTVRQQLLLLGQLAFYCGAGYKTAMGMGRVKPV